MLVWILQTGEPLHCDGDQLRPMRAINLSKALVSRGHKVEIISTRFFHQEKRFRKYIKNKNIPCIVETLIDSPGYESNISIKRLFDHHILSFNLLINLLKREDKPDIMFVGFPPIEWSLIAVFYSYFKSIPIIIDVKDLWPDIFWDREDIYNIKKKCIKCLFFPYIVYCIFIASLADYITGPTELIANYFKNNYQNKFFSNIFKNKSPKTFSSPIVPPKGDENIKLNILKSDPKKGLNIMFLGSLMSVYDFETIKKSIEILNEKKIKIKIFIAGGGGSENHIKNIFQKNENVYFLGWISRKKAIEISANCHLALAPYKNIKNYELNLVNKYIDYMSLGLPVLSPLKGFAYELIKKHEIGWNYNPQDSINFAQTIIEIIEQPHELTKRSSNAFKLYETKFSYEKVYNRLVYNLEKIINYE
jgi:glycosyltransferase involved in cell wall biosynthesis